MTKRIAITGASGFIGRQLVPLLAAEGYELVLCDRGDAGFSNQMVRCDAVLHLSSLDNDAHATMAQFMATNVDGLSLTIDAARVAKVPLFIYPATLQASGVGTAYEKSKAVASEYLSGISGINVVKLLRPTVYGKEFSGKLKWLNNLPRPLVSLIFPVLASLKPTLHISKLVDGIVSALHTESSEEKLLTDCQHKNWFYHLAKRIIDIGFALGILVGFWWLLLGVWVAVRLTSEGPGIFAQKRVGRFGKIFTLYKFRTMAKDTKQAGSHEVSSASLTKIGSFLRKTKIDELPQIFNILRGEISLIGPRPCLEVQQELVTARKARHVPDILPGITGYAQVQGIDMSDPQLLAKTDEEYMKLRTLPLDFKILIATFVGRGNGDRIKG